jgi:hypothetical protein
MTSFTISAAHRYKDLIIMYNNECIKYNSRLAEKINSFIIYNTPGVIENIAVLLTPLIETNVRDRIILYNKTDSVKPFNEFLINNNLKN